MIEMTDRRFGMLIVCNFSHVDQMRKAFWVCRCSCGNLKTIRGTDLRIGHTISCGCFRVINSHLKSIHGECGTRLHVIWKKMIQRCGNESSKDFARYGARGIRVCGEWRHDFVAFRNWALPHGYADNLTIDRINNDGNYEPGNCQWLTRSRNTSKANMERAARKRGSNVA
jgi:hypothetical protein